MLYTKDSVEETGKGGGAACLFNYRVKNQHANCFCRSQNQTKQTTSELGSIPPRQDLLHHALKLPARASGNISFAVNVAIIQLPANEPTHGAHSWAYFAL